MTIDFTVAQAANTIAAGPTGGADAVPTMRALVWADFDATLRAALLANINCAQAGQINQWLEFALCPDGLTTVSTLSTGVQFSDRPPAFTFLDVPRMSCLTAPVGTAVTVDIKFGSTAGVGGTSIFSTKLVIPVGAYSATAPVLSTTTHVDNEEMVIIVDSTGTGVRGCKVRMPVQWTGGF